MLTTPRLLGLAFAAADVLIELDGEGRVVVALGAAPAAGVDLDSWRGAFLADHLGKAARKPLADALAALAPGARSQPLEVLLPCDATMVRRARVTLFQLPELAPSVSCAVSYDGAPFPLAAPAPAPMLDTESLLSRVEAALGDGGQDLAVAFVDVAGLAVDSEAHQRAGARIEAVLREASVDGASAARLAPERYAVVRDAADAPDLSRQLREASRAEGLDLAVETTQSRLADGPAAPTIRALRHALGVCISEGAGGAGGSFAEALTRTLKEETRFRGIVREHAFSLEYQPIVSLADGATHHYEALARFSGDSPGATIRMAEELGLIEGFDLAVAEKCVRQMDKPGFDRAHIAINVSGVSLESDAYVEALLAITERSRGARRRLLVEVTETAALTDVGAANARLALLREHGIRVCLDDFGVGAASLDYLHRLSVDTVKIDGRFVRSILDDDKSRALIAHLVELCGDLGVTTVAEMIETAPQAEAVRRLGVDYGQGWLFGRPAPAPSPSRRPAPTETALRQAG